jgi:hypothetical protein
MKKFVFWNHGVGVGLRGIGAPVNVIENLIFRVL